MYIDTHCHLDFPEFDKDRKEVIEISIKEGLQRIINVGTMIETSRRAIELSLQYEIIRSTVGIHPTHASALSLAEMKVIEEFAKNERVVGIGETGLDFNYGRDSEEKQKKLFKAHIDIAGKMGLPLIIHNREARDEIIDILEKNTVPKNVVFHCFGGDDILAEYCMNRGFYISFTGIITFKKTDDVKRVCKRYPLEKIMAETDAPYLSPEPFRGRRNNPSMVRYVVETIAGIKEMEADECAAVITRNSKEFFGI